MRRSFTKVSLFVLGLVAILVALFPYYVSFQHTQKESLLSAKESFQQRTSPREEKRPSTVTTSAKRENTLTTSGRTTEEPHYHVVFSTSCVPQQHWESYVLFYHAKRVRQKGSVTRIVSGCNEKEAAELEKFHEKYIATMAVPEIQSFHLHQTPDFSKVSLSEGKNAYKYNNKPFGLRHWMEHSLQLGWTAADNNSTIIVSPYLKSQPRLHQDLLDGIVILMDPDMVLLRPITHDFSDENQLWANGKRPEVLHVTHGHPIAQQDGYLNNEWMKLNFTYITQSESIHPPPWGDGPLHWNTGPPYLATVQDMYKIVSLWTETAPRVLEIHPKLFAEMYGFITATVMLNLPFALTQSIVVSTTTAVNREGWPLIDGLPDNQVCSISRTATTTGDISSDLSNDLPVLLNGLHYCKRYSLGKWFFSKYRLKKNIMNCDKNLLMLPPDDLYPKLTYTILPPRADLKDVSTYKEERNTINTKQAKREAFMLCGMMNAVNEALKYYKKQACISPNLNETYTVHDDPTNY